MAAFFIMLLTERQCTQKAKRHCSAAVSSVADDRHTCCLTATVHAADGRRTIRNTV
ncbi:MAG: hypothetical protein HXL32_03950 [Prevotellaceae bacterium]|nr:hypothetical protein [Prevotellaceae bacterium]